VNVDLAGGAVTADLYAPAAGAYPPTYYNPEIVRGGYPGIPQPVAPAPSRGGLQTVLDEKPLKVTLVLNVVRLLPRK
jgi:hypothetical protein